MMKVNKRALKQLVLNEMSRILNEQDADDVEANERSETSRPSLSSADDQIDSFILKFENNSIKKDSDDLYISINESLADLSLGTLLEQEEEEGEDPEADAPDDADPPAPAADDDLPTSDDISAVLPAVDIPKPPLDMDAFAKRIARLVMNYDTLLDLPTVIINRAINFIDEHYDSADVETLKQILDTEFDFNIEGERDIPTAPLAVGAWAGGTGGGGGG